MALLFVVENCKELFPGAMAVLSQAILGFILRCAVTSTGSTTPWLATNCLLSLVGLCNSRPFNLFFLKYLINESWDRYMLLCHLFSCMQGF